MGTLRRTRRQALARAARASAAGALALAGCGEAPPSADRANLLFVSIDTLRADHVGCYGHPHASTPTLDRLAEQGTRFATCISSCPLTLPSHSTMMTGTYPFVHGARVNLAFTLADENVTLAEELRDAGYATHAEVGAAVLDGTFGLSQGFEGYGEALAEAPGLAARMGAEAIDRGEAERPAREVTDAALDWLAQHALARREGDARPFFLFVHYFDPHKPWIAPEPFRSAHGGGYLAEIAYTDAEVGRLLDGLERHGFEQDTLVVLTSDHGDGLDEHDEPTHGTFLYDATLHVPLVVRWPGRVAEGRVVEAQVGLVDLFPTVLELLGPEVPGDLQAGLQGTSLVPLLEDPARDPGRAIYAETLEPRMTFGYAALRAVRTGDWKYVHGPEPELYDLERDPRELRDLARAEAERAERMAAALRQIVAGAPALRGRGVLHELAPADTERLAMLGYASSEGPQDGDDPREWSSELEHLEPNGANPRGRTEEMYLFYTGLGALRDADFTAAVEHWQAYVELAPEHAAGRSFLAQALALAGRPAEAVPELERALELDASRCEDRQILGSMLAEAGDHAGARRQLELARDCDPDDPLAAFNLGKLLLLAEEPAAALAALDRARDLVPDYAPVHVHRARALRALDRNDEASASLRRASALDPSNAATLGELASALVASGSAAEALDTLDTAISAGLRPAPLLAQRLRLLATAPDPAVRDAARAQRIATRLLAGEHAADPRILAAAAAAMAESGDFPTAVSLAERAIAAARERDATRLAERTLSELAGYREGRPAHEH